jgi:hypothetical protein
VSKAACFEKRLGWAHAHVFLLLLLAVSVYKIKI